ncbi:TolC family protein [Sulfurimonas sp. HSL3-7]|uniref:TolC family protein n=1 Tax=Sulfonitrofixus jiaomeiensis TaxID=3131938 RepID=UPI0031F7B791
MRVLHDLKKLSVLCSLLLATAVTASGAETGSDQNATLLFETQQMSADEQKGAAASLEEYLSELKRRQFGYEYEKADQESSKLRDSWIQPVKISYSITRQNPYNEQGREEVENQNGAIAIDQPIFQSGGIIYGIKFANASREYANYSIDQQKRIMIKQAVDLLMQIKQSELSIAKQQLQIANSEINLEQKREQYLNGQLDSGFLNNAILEKNIAVQALYDLETGNEQLIAQFKKISDLDPKRAKIPFLALLDEGTFLARNIDLKLAESESEKNRYNKNVTLMKYLPAVNLQASYNWQKQQSNFVLPTGPTTIQSPETIYYRYGLSASMPLDINSYNDFEAAKVEYLKSQVVIDDKKRELKLLYEQVMQNLKKYDKKIALADDNRNLYEALLDETRGLFKAGYKTQYDVDTLSNSLEIEGINKKIYEIDKQLELLSLYEKVSSDL